MQGDDFPPPQGKWLCISKRSYSRHICTHFLQYRQYVANTVSALDIIIALYNELVDK